MSENEEMEGVTEAAWVGGPYDGQAIWVPDGTTVVTMLTTVYAGESEEDAVMERVLLVPIESTKNGPRIMWYDAILKEDR